MYRNEKQRPAFQTQQNQKCWPLGCPLEPDEEQTTSTGQIRHFTPEELSALGKLSGILFDTLIQAVALEFALVEAKVLTPDQVQRHLDGLNRLPFVVKARTAYGARSEVLDELLRSYKGPIQ